MASIIFLIKNVVALLSFQIYFPNIYASNLFQTTDECKCGSPSLKAMMIKIVNGKEAKFELFPWMAAITFEKKIHCGGSLINKKYILTAAHCFPRGKKDKLEVYLGIDGIKSISKGSARPEKIDTIIIHQEFTSEKKYPDIALIKLKKPVALHDKIKTICLTEMDNTALVPAQVAGWGKLFENGVPAKKLQYTNLTIITNEECKKNEELKKEINLFTICAYGGNKDACQGDSGGPLMVKKMINKTVMKTQLYYWEQVGIVSFGIGCGRPDYPGIYANIYKLLHWIAEHTRDTLYCEKPS